MKRFLPFVIIGVVALLTVGIATAVYRVKTRSCARRRQPACNTGASGSAGRSVPARARSAQCAGDVGDLWRLPVSLLRPCLAGDRRIAKAIRGQSCASFFTSFLSKCTNMRWRRRWPRRRRRCRENFGRCTICFTNTSRSGAVRPTSTSFSSLCRVARARCRALSCRSPGRRRASACHRRMGRRARAGG